MSEKLSDYRDEIDKIDKELIKLFEKRMNIVLKVAKYKKKNNLNILHKNRENEVLTKNLKQVENKYLKPYVENFLIDLMSVSKQYQKNNIDENDNKSCLKLGYQGEVGSFSEEALTQYFGENENKNNYKEFEDVFKAIKNDEIKYGILPIENSLTGSISEIYDYLNKYELYIVGEKKLKIKHNLIGLKSSKKENIKTIYSHIQGFMQSSKYLESFPECDKIPYYNTATSVKYVAKKQNENYAAIGSKRAAETYGLKILDENINNINDNYTRFIIIGKKIENNTNCDKMTISFSVPNIAGALYDKLKIFAKHKINMRKIESRPIGDGTFSYLFYVDLDGNLNDTDVKDSIKEFTAVIDKYKLLGCYKRDDLQI